MPGIAAQFAEVPMSQLIGGPLQASVEAASAAAKSTAEFIETVGMKKDDKGVMTTRMVDFSFIQPTTDADGKVTPIEAKVSAPLLAIIPIPSIILNKINVKFDMSVTQTETNTSATEGSAELKAEAGMAWWKVSVSGRISHKSEQTRKTDTTAKYTVEVEAGQAPTPEGLSRLLDILQSAIVPQKK